MEENKIFMGFLVLILLMHFVYIIFSKKSRMKFFDRYVRLDIDKKNEIVDKYFYIILEKSWYIKQLIIIFLSILAIVLIDFNTNTIIYIVLFWLCCEYLYRFFLIQYSNKKNMIKRRLK